ncbi:hypothetical protein F4780DRAFT_403322 [Xylariomycetidae sp. FL0641]|nr:hypothetical protein F4780DRAFT_403322 [Xylariomycetidae sp. FL0641]
MDVRPSVLCFFLTGASVCSATGPWGPVQKQIHEWHHVTVEDPSVGPDLRNPPIRSGLMCVRACMQASKSHCTWSVGLSNQSY